jgi:MFS family permease
MYFRKSKKQQTKDQKNNIIDGVFWAVMFYLITLFLTPYIIYLGATPFQVGLLESLPLFVGSLFGLLSYNILKYFRSKKQMVVVSTIIQAILCFAFAGIYFITTNNIILIIIILFTIYNILTIISRTIHTDWMGHVFVLHKMGYYTAQKQLLLEFMSIFPILLSGFLLDSIITEENIVYGFALLFFVAGLSRLIATHFLNKISITEDKQDIITETKEHKISLLKIIKQDIIDNKEYKFFLIVVFVLYFSIYICSPFYKYYFLSTLGINYIEYVSLHVITIVSTVLSLKYWGKINDIYGASKVLKATVMFIPLYSLLLIFFHKHIFLLFLLNFFDGMIVGGFVIATKTYFYQNTRKDLITHFALFSILQSFGIIIGAFFGSFIIQKGLEFFTKELHVMWFLFGVATLFRIVAVIYVSNIKEKYHKYKTDVNIPKDILLYIPVRQGLNKFSRYLINYEKHAFEKISKNYSKK